MNDHPEARTYGGITFDTRLVGAVQHDTSEIEPGIRPSAYLATAALYKAFAGKYPTDLVERVAAKVWNSRNEILTLDS